LANNHLFAVGGFGHVLALDLEEGPISSNTHLPSEPLTATVFPVPAKRNIFLQTNQHLQDVTIQILDVTGRMISHKVHQVQANLLEIELLEAVSGIHFIHLHTPEQQAVFKSILVR